MDDKKTTAESFIVGFPEEWKKFHDSHPGLPETIKRLASTSEKIFIRECEFEKPADTVIFFLGRVCIEDFSEIFLLAGNGYGLGASKLLRGLYERAVNAAYISKNPHEATSFIEYGFVNSGKLLNHTKGFLGKEIERINSKQLSEIEGNYKLYKDKFKEIICVKCNTYRTRISWSTLDLLSMAKKVNMGKLYVPCYLLPTFQIHATVQSMSSRVEMNDEGSFRFNSELQPEWAERSLVAAHSVLLHVIDTQNDHFNLGLDDEIKARGADYKAVWKKSA